MSPSRAKADTPAKKLLRRALWVAGILAIIFFAVQGGEYGTADVLSQRGRRDALKRELAAMRATVDSLEAEVKSVRTDNARLERIAREEYGMVKGDKEVLYWTNRRQGDVAKDSVALRAASDSTGV